MQRLEHAVSALQEVLVSPPRFQGPWRHLVRERLGLVQEALDAEHPYAPESWLDARAGRVTRERDRLLALLTVLRASVGDATDLEALRRSLLDLVQELHHHQQRCNDLAYDGVAMEVGGSE